MAKPIPNKVKPTKADLTVQKILEVSLNRIIQEGESGISMTDISREMGISRPTLYRYFPTREALLSSAFQLVIKDYSEKLLAHIENDPSPLRRIDVIANFIELRLNDGGPQLYQMEPKLVIKLINEFQHELLVMSEQVFAPLFDMAETLSGKPVDRQSAANAFLLFHLGLAFFTDQPPANVGDMIRKMIRSLVHFY